MSKNYIKLVEEVNKKEILGESVLAFVFPVALYFLYKYLNKGDSDSKTLKDILVSTGVEGILDKNSQEMQQDLSPEIKQQIINSIQEKMPKSEMAKRIVDAMTL